MCMQVERESRGLEEFNSSKLVIREEWILSKYDYNDDILGGSKYKTNTSFKEIIYWTCMENSVAFGHRVDVTRVGLAPGLISCQQRGETCPTLAPGGTVTPWAQRIAH